MATSNSISPFERAMTLAAVCGSKIALGPAFLATSKRRPNAGAWVAGAMGEMILDKLGVFPARFRPALLVPHTLAGAWVAHESLKEDGVEDTNAVVMAAVVAAGVAGVAPMVRITLSKGLGIPDRLLGLAEDYLFLKLATRATGITMEELPGVARNAVQEVGEQVEPTARSLGLVS